MASNDVSEAAQVLGRLVRDRRALSDDAAEDLEALVGARLSDPPPQAKRWDRLRLVVVLIEQAQGVLPTAAAYEAARRERGVDVPAASTLAATFGDWLAAVCAAARLLQSSREAPARAQATRYRAPYRPGECAAAVARFYRAFGKWPSHTEYAQWSRYSRHAARRCGAPDPVLPAAETVRRQFGTFDRAVVAAKDLYGEDGKSDA